MWRRNYSQDNKRLLNKIDGDIRNVENKISKLLELHLEDKIDKEKYIELKKNLQELKTEKKELNKVEDEEKTIKDRIASFRKLFESKEPIVEFDREVFKIGLTSKIDGYKQFGKSKERV